MRTAVARNLTVAIGISVPVLALATGCPLPGLGTSPTPTPKASASPTANPARSAVLMYRINFDSSGHHTIWIQNNTSASVDMSQYALAYISSTFSGTNYVYLRPTEASGAAAALAAGATVSVHVNETGTSTTTNWFVSQDTALGGAGTATMGMQSTDGSVGLFANESTSGGASPSWTAANMTDYLQYGSATSSAYSLESVAKTAGYWTTGTLAPAGSPGKSLIDSTMLDGASYWSLQ
ncbi:MAG: hypothetical protein KGR26_12235 [Cyanobacteria bacterium REEB65]|nr:hypothetical protein [Cyanobacteria bacterium REEB65]